VDQIFERLGERHMAAVEVDADLRIITARRFSIEILTGSRPAAPGTDRPQEEGL
jgi:hypothetical protein